MKKLKKELIKIIKKYKFRFLLICLLIIGYEVTNVIPHKKIGNIIDLLVNNAGNRELLIQNFSALFICGIIYFISRTLGMIEIRRTEESIEENLENTIFERFLNLKLKDMQNIKNGELMSYISKYIRTIRRGMMAIIMNGIRPVILFSALFILMMIVNIKLTLAVLIPAFIEVFIFNYLKQKIKDSETIAQNAFTEMSEFVQESTDSIRTSKAFNGEEEQIEIFKKKSKKVEKYNILVNIYSALSWNSISICFGTCYTIAVIFGTHLILNGEITVGEFISFNMYIKMLYHPLRWIPKLISRYKAAQVAIEKVNKLYELNLEYIEENTNDLSGDIVIENLNFSFNSGKNVLKNINIKISKGETLGIIGTIGSGKSTIANLLLRLYDISNGQIYINGRDINTINLSDIRQNICYIAQENFLFSDTVSENIKLYDEKYSDDEVLESARNSALSEDIKKMNDGINTLVGEKGITLSGGQKQRVSIARAFLRKKNFIIFDDTFSALDNRTEKIILENLRELLDEKTCIIISNRISDVKNADKIIVLDKGEIVQEGQHQELLEQEGLYKKFYEEQSSNQFLNEEYIGE